MSILDLGCPEYDRKVEERLKTDAVKRPLDRLVICRGDDKDGLPGQNCPHCGKPLMLVGKETLGMPVNGKAYCEHCTFEEEF